MIGPTINATQGRTILVVVRQAIDWRVDYREGGKEHSATFDSFGQVSAFVRETLPLDEREYIVLGLMADDAKNLDDDESDEPGRYARLFASLSPALQELMAQRVCDNMWDADRWEDALRDALDGLVTEQVDATLPAEAV